MIRMLTCADVTLGLTWQDTIRAGTCGACEARGGAWWRVERMLMRQKFQLARRGAHKVVFGHSWLGFARDWLFCHFMPLLWQLDEQNDDIREL